MDRSIESLVYLPTTVKSALKKGGIETATDLLVYSPTDIAKRCKIPLSDVMNAINTVSKNQEHHYLCLDNLVEEDEIFTTGDSLLDDILGGGIKTGMIWEVAGESSAGKSQLAMQLSLCVQLPKDMGGLSGSACYITTSSKLPTTRLMQMTETNARLPSHLCGLSNIHTMAASTIPMLIQVLSAVLPTFVEAKSVGSPVKLLVIDALAELFHLFDKTSTQTLVERSHHLTQISSHLHALASKYHLAILVINEVVDVFQNDSMSSSSHNGLLYRNQSRFFARAASVFGEDRKEPSLGLVWANQINGRIFLTRTRRRRYINPPDGSIAKHQKTANNTSSSRPVSPNITDHDQPKLIRRLSVIFSPMSIPASVDYIIDISGLRTVPEAGVYIPRPSEGLTEQSRSAVPPLHLRGQELDPLGGGNVEDGIVVDVTDSIDGPSGEQHDEWDEYWKTDEIPGDVYHSIDIDSLTQGDPPLPSVS